MAWMIAYAALAPDEIGDTPCRPQARVVPKLFRPVLEAALDPSPIGRCQPWLAPSASGLL